MNHETRQLIVSKFGTLMLANAELAAENAILRQAVEALKADNERLKAEASAAEKQRAALTENLPANRYADNGALQ
jgi:FtsZ-binding cell division protein ZapB